MNSDSSRTTISTPPTTSEIRLYITAASVIKPVERTAQTIEPNTAARRNRSVLAKGFSPSSRRVIRTRTSTIRSGMPAAVRTDQNMTRPRTIPKAATTLKREETLRTVHGSILRMIRRTRRTVVMCGRLYPE